MANVDRDGMSEALRNAGIDPIPDGMVDDLLLVARRWRKRKLQAVSGELDKAQQEENLRLAYAGIQSGERTSDTLSLVRLAANGLQKDQSSIKRQRVYKKAQKAVRSIKAGRHHAHATQYLLTSLCEVHAKNFGILPRCRQHWGGESYLGKGVAYIHEVWHAITGSRLAHNTIGKYLVDENTRIRMILKEEKS